MLGTAREGMKERMNEGGGKEDERTAEGERGRKAKSELQGLSKCQLLTLQFLKLKCGAGGWEGPRRKPPYVTIRASGHVLKLGDKPRKPLNPLGLSVTFGDLEFAI